MKSFWSIKKNVTIEWNTTEYNKTTKFEVQRQKYNNIIEKSFRLEDKGKHITILFLQQT